MTTGFQKADIDFITELIVSMEKNVGTAEDEKWLDSIAFQGLDLYYLYDKIRKKEPTNDVFTLEIRRLLMIYVARGQKITGVEKSVSQQTSNEIQRLRVKYNVVDQVDTTSRRDSLTLGRLSAIFPHVTATIIARFQKKVRIIANDKGSSLPIYFKFPGSPALFVKANYDGLMKDFIDWSVGFDAVVNRKKGVFSKREDLTLFANNAYQGLFDDPTRISLVARIEAVFQANK
jgi:hypothetical protein